MQYYCCFHRTTFTPSRLVQDCSFRPGIYPYWLDQVPEFYHQEDYSFPHAKNDQLGIMLVFEVDPNRTFARLLVVISKVFIFIDVVIKGAYDEPEFFGFAFEILVLTLVAF